MNLVINGKLILDNLSYFLPGLKTGLAVKVISGTVTIEGSNDNFITAPFSVNFTVDTLSVISETYDYWRMAGEGSFYIGDSLVIDDPVYPYGFNDAVNSSDRFTLGGKAFSRIHNIRKTGNFTWRGVKDSALIAFKTWFDNSNSYRDTFIVEEPFTNELIPCTSTTKSFPFQLDTFGLHSGEILLLEDLT